MVQYLSSLTIGGHCGAEADLGALRGVETLHGAHHPPPASCPARLVTPARVEVDPLIPGRQSLLRGHGRHRLGVAGVAALAGEGHRGCLGLSHLAQVAGLGGGEGGEGGEVGEAELVVGGRRLLEILNSGVGRHRDASAGVSSTRELLIVAEMGNSFR